MSSSASQKDLVDVVDTYSQADSYSRKLLKNEIHKCLTGGDTVKIVREAGLPDVQWTKTLPTLVLYEGQGIDLYDNITRDPTYYLYRNELSILEEYGDDIVEALVGSWRKSFRSAKTSETTKDLHVTVVDLGAGRMDKAGCLLQSLAKCSAEPINLTSVVRVSATYCAVDIQYRELCERLKNLLQKSPAFVAGRHQKEAQDRIGKIAIRGVCGTYLESLDLLRNNILVNDTLPFKAEQGSTEQTKCLLWLGSSFTNVPPTDAAEFLRQFTNEDILNPGDTIIVGLDRCRDVEKVKDAYREDSESWKAYIRNGVRNTGAILGNDAAMKLDGSGDWIYVARWDALEGKHMRFVRSNKSHTITVPSTSLASESVPTRIDITKDEHIFLCQSYKYTSADAEQCFDDASLKIIAEYSNDEDNCSVYLLQRRL